VGFCEIDKKAEAAYRAMYDIEKEVFFNDASKINTDEMPGFDLFVGGFPCQPFSVAGKRRGFEDTRGTLFHHIARIIKAKKPAAFLLENVPGLLSHNEGETYKLCEFLGLDGYHAEAISKEEYYTEADDEGGDQSD